MPSVFPEKLLRKTTLSAVISAAKLVADRLEILTGLEAMLFDLDLKKQLKERSQLHKILEEKTKPVIDDLFVSQRRLRIHGGCTSCRHPGGYECHRRQKHRCHGKCHPVIRSNPVQSSCRNLCCCQR
jgi:hypothetical protein